MVNYYFLLAIELFIVIVNLIIFRGNIIIPAVISSIMILIGNFFAWFSADIWEMQVSAMTMFVVTTGMVTMTIACFISTKFNLNPGKKIYKNDTNNLKLIKVSKSFEVIVMMIVLFLTCLYGLEAYKVGVLNGGSTINAFAYTKSASMGNDDTASMNPLIRQGFKIVTAISYVTIFYLVNNCLILKQKITKNIPSIIIIFSAIIITIFSASRTEILRLFSAGLFDYCILYFEKITWESTKLKKALFSVLKIIVPSVLIIIVIAYSVRSIIKTSNVELSQTQSILTYISYYIGSPLQVLNLKLDMVYSERGIPLFSNNIELPNFVYLGNLNYGGNVATIFEYVLNFGLLGMIIYIFFVYFIGSLLINSFLIKTASSVKRNGQLILLSFCFFPYTMAYYSITTQLLFNITGILTLIFIYIYYKIFILNLK
ncbi:oligosaccharide repeat unit polymerase [Liquorilactobacillus capillatus]|uniref:Oligosaccharide repeat unit polymerase n=1 Tax=Liquorilactobacillus capillatus DSM 19910 TaxID=1423731 RepID=A0A0R1M493_9LACO|nr:oligosaccharide repeat unit polymerase [Liquorilactobacillus capillatus]KRL02601.1 hypothetical protein FC81_GL000638 [Liquorilactobacillus capillatus DSM 19910]